MYLLPAVWGILTGIGIWRLKNWARISMIVFSVLLILMSGFTGLVSLVIPIPATSTNDIGPSEISAIRIGMGVFWFTLLGIGIWWLVFFNQSKVKSQFGQLAVTFAGESTSQTAYSVQTMPVRPTEPGTAKRPLSITILAWLLLVGCLFIPLSLVLHAPAILFMRLLTGWPAIFFFLIFAASQLCIGIGLLRLRPAARIAAIVLFSFGFLNSAVFYFAPGGHARALALMDSQRTMFPWMGQVQGQSGFPLDPAPFLVVGAVGGLVMITVPLYFLVTRKLAFEKGPVDLESRKSKF
jgi:hypothetical protein